MHASDAAQQHGHRTGDMVQGSIPMFGTNWTFQNWPVLHQNTRADGPRAAGLTAYLLSSVHRKLPKQGPYNFENHPVSSGKGLAQQRGALVKGLQDLCFRIPARLSAEFGLGSGAF